MAYTAKDLIAIAQGEIGYQEKATNSSLDSNTANAGNNNYTKYARDLNSAGYYNGNKNGYAWCDVFVDWCFYTLCGNKTDAEYLECQTGDLGAGCVYSKQYYQKAGRLDTTPQVGDQIFFISDGTVSHTGIVETVSSSQITTIEGNSSNQVKRNTYSRTNSYIDSFGHPRYDAESTSSSTASSSSSSSASTATGLETGAKVMLSKTKLYSSATTTASSGTKSGTYYIWSSAQSNGRIRITNSANNVGKSSQITGWINVADISGTSTSTSTSSSSSSASTSTTPTYKVGSIYTLQVDNLNVRTGAGTIYTKVSYSNLTDNAKKNAYAGGGLKKGTKVTCKATKTSGSDVWMQIPSGWIAAYYKNQYYVK